MSYDCTSLYSFAMWNEDSVYPEIENEAAFKPNLNDVYVKAFFNQTINQNGNEFAIVKIKCYSPPDLINQHLPVEEKVNNIAISRMGNGYFVETLTSVDIQETVEI